MVLDTLVIRDEDCTGKLLNQFEIQLSTSVLTLRDVITERVFQEVEIYRAGTTALPYRLVSRETQAIYTIDYEQELQTPIGRPLAVCEGSPIQSLLDV